MRGTRAIALVALMWPATGAWAQDAQAQAPTQAPEVSEQETNTPQPAAEAAAPTPAPASEPPPPQAAPVEAARHPADVGAAHLQAGRYAEAVAAYQVAVELEPNVAMHHLNLGNAYRGSGDLAAAERAYRRAEQLSMPVVPAAPEAPPPDDREPEPQTRSYHFLLAMGYLVITPLGLIGLSALTESAAGLIFVLTPTVIHGAYGNVYPAIFAPVGVVGSSFLGGVIGAATCNDTGELFGCLGHAFAGGLVGYAVWATIDVGLNGSVTVEPDSARKQPRTRVALIPLRDGAGLQLHGAF